MVDQPHLSKIKAHVESENLIRDALEKANMRLVGHGENNTVFLRDAVTDLNRNALLFRELEENLESMKQTNAVLLKRLEAAERLAEAVRKIQKHYEIVAGDATKYSVGYTLSSNALYEWNAVNGGDDE